MIDTTLEKVEENVKTVDPYKRETTDYFKDGTVRGEENPFSALEKALKNKTKIDLDDLMILHINDTDDEETQVQKMNLISLALDNPNEQVTLALYNQYKRVAEIAVEYIPEFGSRNPKLIETPNLERQKMKLLKKALDSKFGLVRSEAVARFSHQFFSTDSELVLSCKYEALKYGLGSIKKDVREGIISDIKYRDDDNERLILLKDMLVRIALESEYVEVREIAKTKIKPDKKEKTLMDFLKEKK